MRLRIGDKVRFLNETGEGIVSRIKDNKTVYVEMLDGFEIPYLISQLVPIHNELIIGKGVENIKIEQEAKVDEAIYFVIEPDHEHASLINDFRLYLFNSSSYHLLYSYSIKDDAYFQTLKFGEIGPFQKVLLKQIKLKFFEEYNSHKIEFLLFKNSYYKSQIPIAEILNISPRVLNQSKKLEHEEFKFPVYAFLLKEDFQLIEAVNQELSDIDITRLKSIKEFKSSQKTSKSNKEYLKSLEKEVDLHIEELIESHGNLSNFEILQIQLERFEKELDAAFKNHLKKIVFIHGVGNGRLRQEIIATLKTTRNITFHDAPYKNYGYGATQINLFNN